VTLLTFMRIACSVASKSMVPSTKYQYTGNTNTVAATPEVILHQVLRHTHMDGGLSNGINVYLP